MIDFTITENNQSINCIEKMLQSIQDLVQELADIPCHESVIVDLTLSDLYVILSKMHMNIYKLYTLYVMNHEVWEDYHAYIQSINLNKLTLLEKLNFLKLEPKSVDSLNKYTNAFIELNKNNLSL